MLTDYRQLTAKYLKANLRRTILTIIGIILAVSLISSIGFFLMGIQNIRIQEMKDTHGSFHLLFQNPNEELISRIKNNPKVSRSGIIKIGNKINISKNLYLTEYLATDQALELMPYKIKQGRLPDSPAEIALEEWVIGHIDRNTEVGDSVSLHGKDYILVGVLENQVQGQLKQNGILLTKNNAIQNGDSMLLVEINPKTNLTRALEELKQLAKKESIKENAYLLVTLGVGESSTGFQGVYTVVYTIITIVIIATIAVIYNSFQISVVERVKQFGLLRTIGCTPKQIRKIVFREATILAIISIPIGILFGIIAIYGISVFYTLLVDESSSIVKNAISLKIIFIGIGLGLLSIYTSAYFPASFAGRIPPLAAVSSRALITKEKIKRRKHWLIRKLFGFEGELALKNIKRNTRRYRITLFSIFISVVLFITFASFIDMNLNISENLNESMKVHFSIIRDINQDSITIDNSTIEKIKAVNTVQKVFKVYPPTYFSAVLSQKSKLAQIENMNEIYQRINQDGTEKILMKANVAIYDSASLEVSKKYVESGSIDIERLNKENGVILIKKNWIYNNSSGKTYVGPVANIKVGDVIELQSDDDSKYTNEPGSGENKGNKVKVMAILSDDPFNFRGNQNAIKIITTEDIGKRLMNVNNLEPINLNIVIDNVQNEEITKVALEDIIIQNSSLQLVNLIDSNRKTKSVILMVKILLYGFVVVVSCIGGVNIINTSTTNIILRKREFAILKSIGLSQNGLKKIITLEGILYGLQGSIFSSIVGCGLSYFMYLGLSTAREYIWKIPWSIITIAIIASLIIGYISILAPLARIKKENLIDVVREDH